MFSLFFSEASRRSMPSIHYYGSLPPRIPWMIIQGINVIITVWILTQTRQVNTLRPRQNGRHFADDVFGCVFMNENVWISIEISLKFVPDFWINKIPALVQIMAWRRPGDKPWSALMMVNLLTPICVTRPQWVNPKLCWEDIKITAFSTISQHWDCAGSWEIQGNVVYIESIPRMIPVYDEW